MKKALWNIRFRIGITAVFLLGIVFMAGRNYSVVQKPAAALISGTADFRQTVKTISKGYLSDDLWGKKNFINLNGAFARASGRRSYNNVVLLKNGMLTYGTGQLDVSTGSSDCIDALKENITQLENRLEERGIAFSYVQLPIKMTSDHSLLPAGTYSYADQDADRLLFKLAENLVPVLDLRPLYCDNEDMIGQYFYRTDHHWNPDGAFLAFRAISEHIRQTAMQPVDIQYTDADLWQRHILNDWFLGSHGKRVGRYFAGLDDLVWYTPLFETEMSCSIPHRKEFFRGSFEAANMRQQYITASNYFSDNPYCVYIGGDYPIVYHRNAAAPNHMRLLIIKDSFMLPLQAFLSTEFSEVDVLDPRHYTASGILDYIDWSCPDIVLFAINPSNLSNSSYAELGITDMNTSAPDRLSVASEKRLVIPPGDSRHNYRAIPVTPEEGRIYQVSVKHAKVIHGDTDAFSMLLFDFANNRIVSHMIFDIPYCEKNEGYVWTFAVPDSGDKKADYQLLVYAGIHGSTSGIGIDFSGIHVSELISGAPQSTSETD